MKPPLLPWSITSKSLARGKNVIQSSKSNFKIREMFDPLSDLSHWGLKPAEKSYCKQEVAPEASSEQPQLAELLAGARPHECCFSTHTGCGSRGLCSQPTLVKAFACAPLAPCTLNSRFGGFYLVAFTSSVKLSSCCEPLMYKRH